MHLHHQTTYQAAKTVAPSIEEHFARQLASALERGAEALAPAPPRHIIEAFIDTAFWASLRREEGQSPKISIAFLPPDKAGQPLLFEDQLHFTPEALNKISPGVQRPGIHLGVWAVQGELRVWGTTRLVPHYCFIVDVPEPGLLVVKHRRADGFGKFANVAVLKGDQVKLVDETTASLPDCPELLTKLLRLSSQAATGAPMNVLIQMAVSMRAHGRGGTLLVVPPGTSAWRESIVHPITYSLQPAFSGLAELMKQDEEEKKRSRWRESLRLEVESIAGLTAIDGATLLSEEYELLAFGIKIGRRIGSDPVRSLLFTEPVVGSKPVVIHPAQHGGTRHLSAAQFVHDQHDGMALIASQDGSFTIYAWSPCHGMVQAHRIDTLLL